MTEEYKTLSELDVQPGDVVESMAGSRITIKTMTTDLGSCVCHFCGLFGATVIDTYDIEWSKRNPIWRIVSRAPDTPKPLRDMTDAEIGALVRAKNEGRVIEVVDTFNGAWVPAPMPGWWPRAAYRVRPEPYRETVTLHGSVTDEVWGRDQTGYDTHRITFELIDGKPDCGSIKIEPL